MTDPEPAAATTRAPRGGRQPRAKAIDVDEAARLYESGHSLRQIAAKVGLSPSRLRLRLLQAGVVMRPAGVRAPAGDLLIVELRGQGLSWSEIGDVVGMTKGGVRNRHNAVTGFPAEPDPPAGPARITDEQLLEIKGWGATNSQAAAMLGLTVGAVASRLYRARRRRVP